MIQKIKVRDLRNKEKFQVDDAYLNGFAGKCGWKATLAYLSLCRHANKDQFCFPTTSNIGKEHNVSRSVISEGINILKDWNIISVEQIRTKSGSWKNNAYALLDKSLWSKPATRVSNSDTVVDRVSNSDTVPACNDNNNNLLNNNACNDIKEPYSLNKLNYKGKEIKVKTVSSTQIFLKFWGKKWTKEVGNGKIYMCNFSKEGKIVKELFKNFSLEELEGLADKFFQSEDQFICNSGYTISMFKVSLPRLIVSKESTIDTFLNEE